MPAATDTFQSNGTGMTSPCTSAEAVTPSDTVDLTNVSRAIWVGTAGNVSLITKAGQTVTFVGVQAGTLLPIRASRIRATSTTASNMLALS